MVFQVIAYIAAIVYFLYKVFTELPTPDGWCYDWEKEKVDIDRGIPYRVREKKRARGHYNSPSAEVRARKFPPEVLPGVVDIERYNRDLATLHPETVEYFRKIGDYRIIKKEVDYH